MHPTLRKTLRYVGYYHVAVGGAELLNQQSSQGGFFSTFASLPTLSSLAPTDFGSINIAWIDLLLGVGMVLASHHL